VKYTWEVIAQELRASGLKEYEIEEARICFEKGMRLLLKMYFDYKARHSSPSGPTENNSCNNMSKDVM